MNNHNPPPPRQRTYGFNPIIAPVPLRPSSRGPSGPGFSRPPSRGPSPMFGLGGPPPPPYRPPSRGPPAFATRAPSPVLSMSRAGFRSSTPAEEPFRFGNIGGSDPLSEEQRQLIKCTGVLGPLSELPNVINRLSSALIAIIDKIGAANRPILRTQQARHSLRILTGAFVVHMGAMILRLDIIRLFSRAYGNFIFEFYCGDQVSCVGLLNRYKPVPEHWRNLSKGLAHIRVEFNGYISMFEEVLSTMRDQLPLNTSARTGGPSAHREINHFIEAHGSLARIYVATTRAFHNLINVDQGRLNTRRLLRAHMQDTTAEYNRLSAATMSAIGTAKAQAKRVVDMAISREVVEWKDGEHLLATKLRTTSVPLPPPQRPPGPPFAGGPPAGMGIVPLPMRPASRDGLARPPSRGTHPRPPGAGPSIGGRMGGSL
ncbi:hypothetical protein T439DRAFT_357475 [Meredithblackwellia eburnea MCA 4105]